MEFTTSNSSVLTMDLLSFPLYLLHFISITFFSHEGQKVGSSLRRPYSFTSLLLCTCSSLILSTASSFAHVPCQLSCNTHFSLVHLFFTDGPETVNQTFSIFLPISLIRASPALCLLVKPLSGQGSLCHSHGEYRISQGIP